jgi:hypothetical protein
MHPALPAILDLARWAPSGDNTQPWRFEAAGDCLIIHGHDTRDHCVYDLRGHASLIALGALLETIAIAASTQGLRAAFTPLAADEDHLDPRPAQPADSSAGVSPATSGRYRFAAAFSPFPSGDVDAKSHSDPLASFIEKRVTQRRPLSTRRITPQQQQTLSAALPPGFRVEFRPSIVDRFRLARLLFRSAHIRLTTREAYETHRVVIQWGARFSEDRIPDQAVGVDPLTRRLMRWVMGSWGRVQFLNRFLAGTIAPRVQLDFMPALRCAGHFFLIAENPPSSSDDFVAAGRALQRYWLTATSLGLLAQPEMTPLIFAQYTKAGVRFTQSQQALDRAARITGQLDDLLGREVCQRTVFMGRIGFGRNPVSRSLRLPVERLMKP